MTLEESAAQALASASQERAGRAEAAAELSEELVAMHQNAERKMNDVGVKYGAELEALQEHNAETLQKTSAVRERAQQELKRLRMELEGASRDLDKARHQRTQAERSAQEATRRRQDLEAALLRQREEKEQLL